MPVALLVVDKPQVDLCRRGVLPGGRSWTEALAL